MNGKIGSIDFFTPNVPFCVSVTLSRYIRIGENLLNEVPVEKSILVDFDQFITLVNKWKAKWVHEGYSEKREKGAMITLILSLLTLFLICEKWQFHQNITLKNTEENNYFGFLLIENL